MIEQPHLDLLHELNADESEHSGGELLPQGLRGDKCGDWGEAEIGRWIRRDFCGYVQSFNARGSLYFTVLLYIYKSTVKIK